MKKIIKAISFIICFVTVFCMLIACSDPGAPDHSVAAPDYAIEPDRLAQELDLFMEGAGNDRTSYTYNEKLAAAYLQSRMTEFGYDNVTIDEFTAEENNSKYSSQNVVAVYNSDSGAEDAKNIVIVAYYDNRYSDDYANIGYRSDGALSNGTGVAALLTIADYLVSNNVKLDFDVTFAFIGAGYLTDIGTRALYSDMSVEERKNTVLMIELQRLGGDHIYAYSDARATKRETFFDGIAADNELDIYKATQKSPHITNAYSVEGVPYFQWAQNGLFAPFAEVGIPTLNLVGANWETSNFTDLESADNDNISYTTSDNLESLKRIYPDYAQKMATAVTLVIRSVENENFISVMQYDKDNYPDTRVLTRGWIWYLIIVCAVAVAAIVMFIISAKLTQKYPITPVAPPRMKMAVFGMDYEDKNAADIFVDISNGADEIFPGVPNNDAKPDPLDPFDDIFPMIGMKLGGNENGESAQSRTAESKTDKSAEKTEPNTAVEGQEPKTTDSASDNIGAQVDEPSDAEKKTSESEQNTVKTITVEHKPIKRKTVSAGKSNTAKKTTGKNTDGATDKTDKKEQDDKDAADK